MQVIHLNASDLFEGVSPKHLTQHTIYVDDLFKGVSPKQNTFY